MWSCCCVRQWCRWNHRDESVRPNESQVTEAAWLWASPPSCLHYCCCCCYNCSHRSQTNTHCLPLLCRCRLAWVWLERSNKIDASSTSRPSWSTPCWINSAFERAHYDDDDDDFDSVTTMTNDNSSTTMLCPYCCYWTWQNPRIVSLAYAPIAADCCPCCTTRTSRSRLWSRIYPVGHPR